MKQITIAEAIQRTVEHREVFHDEMLHVMRQIMRGELSPAQIAGFIIGLRVKKETIGEIAAAVGTENVIFEAPSKAAQAWFVKQFGPDVNLGNIPPEEVIPLETLRLGLRGDTLAEILEIIADRHQLDHRTVDVGPGHASVLANVTQERQLFVQLGD